MQSNAGKPAILDVWSHIHPRYGGIGPAAGALAQAVQNRWNCATGQLAVCHAFESERTDATAMNIQTVVPRGRRPLADASLIRPLRSAISHCDVCHVHGLWEPHSLAVRKIGLQLGKPIVSSVHGMLERWELSNKRFKKTIYSLLFERPSLARSSCLRALSVQEAEDYRRFGLDNPIALIPNGIAPLTRVDTSEFLAEHPYLQEKRVVLFLGRIHHKKGVLRLLEAWPTIVGKHRDAHLLIAGAEYEETGAIAHQLIRATNIQDSVTFAGVLSGYRKLAALSMATCFCLPSYSEGMSIAALEALSIGLPVVITPACNIDGVTKAGAGYVCSNNPAELATSISDCLSLTSLQWNAMSSAASSLASLNYDWSVVGQQMAAVYAWLLGGPRPDCILR